MAENRLKKCIKNRLFQEATAVFVISVILLIYSLTEHYRGVKVEWKMSPYLFPVLVATIMLILSVSLFSQAVDEVCEKNSAENESEGRFNRRNFLVTLALAFAYYMSMKYVPFIVSTSVLLAAMMLLLKERRPAVVISVSVITSVAAWLIFGVLLHVNLP